MPERIWRPKYSVVEYERRLFDSGQVIADHIVKAHNGIPATACHKCGTLNATVRDLRELLQIAIEFESKNKSS